MKTQIMGILNTTPDSFFAKSRVETHSQALSRAVQLLEEGADIIDVGGEATSYGRFPKQGRTGGPVNCTEEKRRVLPIIQALKNKTSAKISIDTTKPEVARAALDLGAKFLNDQSGFRDPEMRDLAVSHDVDICIMHMQGTPATMQVNPHYPEGVVKEVVRYLEEQANRLIQMGKKQERVFLDPGIGFGKTVEDNFRLLSEIEAIKELGMPVLVGISRKSLMTHLLDLPAEKLLIPTIALNTYLLLKAVDIIRVHDVLEHRHVVDLFSKSGLQ